MAFARLLRMTSGETHKLHVSQPRVNRKKKNRAGEARGQKKQTNKQTRVTKKRHTQKRVPGCMQFELQ